MKRSIEEVFGGGRAVLDIGVRGVTERGIKRSDGALVAGLALAPIDLESLDREQVAALNAGMAGFLAGLDTSVQLLVSNNRFDSEGYLSRTIERWRGDWLTKTGLRERLVASPDDPDAWSAFASGVAADGNLRQIRVRLMLPAHRGRGKNPPDAESRIERIGAALSQAGIAWRAMSGLELVLELERAFLHGGGLLANALAAGGPVRIVEGLENLAFDLADPLPEWIEFAPRHMRFPRAERDRYCAAGYLRALPRAVEPGWLALPSKFDFDMTLSLHIDPLPDEEVMRRVAQSEREIAGALDDAAGVDPVAAREQRWRAEDVGELAEAMRGRERYFKLGGYYLVGADSQEELDDHLRTLRSVLSGIGLVGSGAFGYQRQALLSVLPLARERLIRRRGITTAPLAAAHPGSGRGRADPDGWLLAACGWDKGPSAPFLFNPFAPAYENPHVAILGQSGTGKTHLARAIAHSAWLSGAEVALIDPKNEYDSLCRRYSGSEISLDLGGGSALNVFDAVGDDESSYAGGIANVAGFWRAALGKMSDHQAALLSNAIEEICPPPGDRTGRRPLASDLAAELAGDHSIDGAGRAAAQDLAQRLRRFCGPAMGRLFSSPTNVHLDNDFLSFKLAGLRAQDVDVFSLAVRLTLLALARWVKRPADRRLILIDEAWCLLHDRAGSRFLLDLAKTARAQGAMLLMITQDVADFAANPLARSVLANCSAAMIFRQHRAHAAALAELFDLDSEGSARVSTLRRGQALAALAAGERVAIEVFDHPW
ncbi:MAG: ATP-binding protein [Chloroflexota bacterium]|nr:ATP-binding protein [Chloroflexota bacterium]